MRSLVPGLFISGNCAVPVRGIGTVLLTCTGIRSIVAMAPKAEFGFVRTVLECSGTKAVDPGFSEFRGGLIPGRHHTHLTQQNGILERRR